MSVEGDHAILICAEETALAVRTAGTDGAMLSRFLHETAVTAESSAESSPPLPQPDRPSAASSVVKKKPKRNLDPTSWRFDMT